MVKDVYYGKTLRKSFARHRVPLEMPNLLEIQKNSYQWFLDKGLQEVFKDVGAISDYAGNLELTFISYTMDEAPKYSVDECKARDATYAAPIKVRVRLRNKETEEIKEQEIFMGDFPLMTKAGTFVINGAERVVVSQIVRSPGIYYAKNADKADNLTYATTVIPYRGAWLEYETDLSDVFWVRIDKNRKIPITCLIRAVGPRTDAEILDMFGEDPRIVSTLEKDTCKNYEEAMLEIYRKLRPGEPPTVDSAESLMNALFFDARRYDLSAVGRYKFNQKLAMGARLSGQTLADPVVDPATGEIIAEAGETLTRARADELQARGVNEAVVDVDGVRVKVFSNHMVDMKNYVSFDPEECGVTEQVRRVVLDDLMEQAGGDEDALKELVADHLDDLIPKHIIVDDIMAS
ncbi:MAG: DNA-directed RNA polymerase subunit beta, partial [Clostridiales bacterium]|nr:DNA-directed RNA polymerase subunit beta [Clostridiales bacterium]